MADAKPQQNIKFHRRIVENHGLGNGVAHGFMLTDKNFFIFLYPDFFFGDSADFADDRNYFKTVIFEYIADNRRFLGQTNAENKTKPDIAHLFRKFTNFLNARLYRMHDIGFFVSARVALAFLNGGLPGKFLNLRIFIKLLRFVYCFFLAGRGASF